MAVEELKPKVRKFLERFSSVEPKRWSIEGSIMELATEVGDLTELVLRKEYYKKNIYDDLDYQIRDELADILFILINIADLYDINIDSSFEEMLGSLDDKLKQHGV